MYKVLMVAMLAAASTTVVVDRAFAQATAPAATEAQPSASFSVETTDLGTLLDDPAAKAVLAKHLPALVENEQIQMARSLTLKQLQSYAGDDLPDNKLAAVQSDLDKLPKR